MKIIELLTQESILPDMQSPNKKGALEELAKTMVPGPDGLELSKVMEVLLDRERLGSTGIGDKGVDFDSMDGKPSHLFFMLLAPTNSAGLHLKALAKISRMLMSQAFRDNLMKAKGAQEIFRLVAERDAEF
jgi:PTS system nitrogen regulatory IIA component